MSGVSLPVIPGAAPRDGSQHGGSRPGSAASGHYTYVPQVYFSISNGRDVHLRTVPYNGADLNCREKSHNDWL
ncbi:hypothetical protein ElyMa_001154400 [Elysia marginata]|uniref:Uncharacterized protein n=1 Tax=Elysia marginata TaxID=1093978 RepID=A0AAV4I381_9GAST|nr:hypothetical protein ElyMa_001154400 [Elysia marginata]